MKDFKASEQVYLCDECGQEMKVLDAQHNEELARWEFDLECRECGPQGKDWLYDSREE